MLWWLPLFALVTSAADTAGIRMAIGQNLLTELEDAFLPKLLSNLQDKRLPDINVGDPKSWFKFDYNLTDIVVKDVIVNQKSSILQFNAESQQVILSLKNMTSTVDLLYDGQLSLFGRSSGSAVLSVSGTNLDIAFDVVSTRENTLHVSIASWHFDDLNLDMDISSDNWFLQFINWWGHLGPIHELNKWIVGHVITLLRGTFNNHIAKLMSEVTYEGAVDIEDKASIGFDYHVPSLTIEEIGTDTILDLAVNGTVYNAAAPGIEPDVAPPVPLQQWIADDTIRIQLQDYTLNSGLWTLAQTNLLSYNITGSMIPPKYPVQLDTSEFALLLPPIAQTYGYGKPMRLDTGPQTTPVVTIDTNSLFTVVSTYIDFMVQTEQGFTRAFRLLSDLELVMDVTLNTNSTGTYALIQINQGKSDFTKFEYTDSEVGVLDLSGLRGAANEVIQLAGNAANDWLDRTGGYRLPLPSWLKLLDVHLNFRSGFIELDATPDVTAIVDFLANR